MSRVSENKEMIRIITKEAEKKETGTFEECMLWHISALNGFLLDISESLAVIADKMSEDQEGE